VRRFYQLLLISTFLPLCWLWMLAIHELGHVLAARATGGRVVGVVLQPLAISRTDVAPNPAPLVVAWAGPLVGVCLPIALWALFKFARWRLAYLARFFAGFCLIANGAYIGIGWVDRVGDTGAMLRCGTPLWWLWSFGTVSLLGGLLLWHHLGPHFGLGDHGAAVEPRDAYLCAGLLTLTVLLELAFS
jgi:uncharacterized membrane protein